MAFNFEKQVSMGFLELLKIIIWLSARGFAISCNDGEDLYKKQRRSGHTKPPPQHNVESTSSFTSELNWHEGNLYWQLAPLQGNTWNLDSEAHHQSLQEFSLDLTKTPESTDAASPLKVCLSLKSPSPGNQGNELVCLVITTDQSTTRTLTFPGAGLLVPSGYGLSVSVTTLDHAPPRSGTTVGSLKTELKLHPVQSDQEVVYQVLRLPYLPENFTGTTTSRATWHTNPPVHHPRAMTRRMKGFYSYYDYQQSDQKGGGLQVCHRLTGDHQTEPICNLAPVYPDQSPSLIEIGQDLPPGAAFGAFCKLPLPAETPVECAIYGLLEVPWLNGELQVLPAIDTISGDDGRLYCANPLNTVYHYLSGDGALCPW